VDLICVTSGRPLIEASIGYAIRRSISSGAMPCASAKIGTMTGEMSGNASTGIRR
jgi:hypothetical protein